MRGPATSVSAGATTSGLAIGDRPAEAAHRRRVELVGAGDDQGVDVGAVHELFDRVIVAENGYAFDGA